MLRVGGQPIEWTDLCVLQPCLPFNNTSSPVTVFKASPQDRHTLVTDAASIKQLTVTVKDNVDDTNSLWFDTGSLSSYATLNKRTNNGNFAQTSSIAGHECATSGSLHICRGTHGRKRCHSLRLVQDSFRTKRHYCPSSSSTQHVRSTQREGCFRPRLTPQRCPLHL